MASKMKEIALMYAMMAMSTPMPSIQREVVVKKDTSHLRKKCKSCKLFKGNFCMIKSYVNPMDTACDKYKHK